jgi:hypothetical protein
MRLPPVPSLLLPTMKELKQLLLRRRRDLLLRYLMQYADGLSYLFYIGFAARTLCNVLLKPLSHLWKQDVFQVISDQLHDLLATKRIVD